MILPEKACLREGDGLERDGVLEPAEPKRSMVFQRILAGALLAYFYNGVITHVPFRAVRKLYLRAFLGEVGKGTGVQMGCRFLHGRKISFGNRNVINFGCLFDGRKYYVRTGDDVSIGPEAIILTLGHDPQAADFAIRGGDVTIGNRAWIGYGALILPAVSIGEGAVIAAKAVVTKDVEPFSIVAGVPARKVGERNRNLTYELNYAPILL